MLNTVLQSYSAQIEHIQLLLMIINALVHITFAGAVARDAGSLYKIGRAPVLVSAYIWAFATLIGGVFVAAIYWFIHYLGAIIQTNQIKRHN